MQKQENFADFSRFESFVEAQETVNDDEEKKDVPQPKLHRRSFSLDDTQVSEYLRVQASRRLHARVGVDSRSSFSRVFFDSREPLFRMLIMHGVGR